MGTGRTLRPILAGAMLVGALLTVDVVAAGPAQAASSMNGTIRRSEVLERAKYWADQGITYTQSARYRDRDSSSHTYRRDCSGLVAMAWHLSGPGPVTADFVGSDSRWTSISRDSMKPGDAMVRNGHMELFAGWLSNSDHSKGAFVYSFNQDGLKVKWPNGNGSTSSSSQYNAVNNTYRIGFDDWTEINSYTKYIRYSRIVDDSYPSSSQMCYYKSNKSSAEYAGPGPEYRKVRSAASGTSWGAYKSTTFVTAYNGTWRRMVDSMGIGGGGGWINTADWPQNTNLPCEPV